MRHISQAQFKEIFGITDAPTKHTGKLAPRGRLHNRVAGAMSKTERRYSQYLDVQKLRGEIHDYWFESLRVKLAANTFYLIDFFVQRPDGTFEIHETKGTRKRKLKSGAVIEQAWSEEDANVKLKVSAALYNAFPHYRVFFASKTGEWILEPKN